MLHQRFISACGLFCMIGLAWLMSEHKRRINLRVVAGGLVLQFVFAVLVLRTGPGQALFTFIGEGFETLLSYVDVGTEFVFGPRYREFPFALRVLPAIIFFSSLMSILYYLRVMQAIVLVFGRLMQRTLGTTGPESLSAAANIFLGQTEAPLVVRPYIRTMTRSELMATMVPGFGSTAGGVLAAYVSMGIDASHLVSASVLSAPAGLLIAKVLVPETKQSLAPEAVGVEVEEIGTNLVEAASIGAEQGIKLAINVAAMLIAFLALITMCDATIGWLGGLFGLEWSIAAALSYLFAPMAWLMGVEAADCLKVGELLGLRMVTNEFVAYERMAEWIVARLNRAFERPDASDFDLRTVRLREFFFDRDPNRRHRRHGPGTTHRSGEAEPASHAWRDAGLLYDGVRRGDLDMKWGVCGVARSEAVGPAMRSATSGAAATGSSPIVRAFSTSRQPRAGRRGRKYVQQRLATFDVIPDAHQHLEPDRMVDSVAKLLPAAPHFDNGQAQLLAVERRDEAVGGRQQRRQRGPRSRRVESPPLRGDHLFKFRQRRPASRWPTNMPCASRASAARDFISSTSPAKASTSSRRSAGPRPARVSSASSTSTALPTIRPVG